MRKPMLPLVCVVLPLLWSCGPKHTELVKAVNWSTDESMSWKGHSREGLVADLGRPTDIKTDGKGGEIYSYNEISGSGGRPMLLPPSVPSDRVIDLDPAPSGYKGIFTPTFVETRELAKFWIDDNGVVYEQWIKPGLKLKKRAKVDQPRRAIQDGDGASN